MFFRPTGIHPRTFHCFPLHSGFPSFAGSMDGSLPLASPLFPDGYFHSILNHDGGRDDLYLCLFDLDNRSDNHHDHGSRATTGHRTSFDHISLVTWTFSVIATLFFFIDGSLYLYYLFFFYGGDLMVIDFFWSVLYIYMN